MTAARTPRRRSRTWLLFFAVLALLAAAAVGLETWYNLRQQLTPGAVEQARARWQERGPAEYDLKYTVTRQAPSGERLVARLRDGALAGVEADGTPLHPELYAFHDLAPLFAAAGSVPGDAGERDVSATARERWTALYLVQVRRGRPVRAWCNDEPVPGALAGHYDMAALFTGLGRLLERDRAAGGWPPYEVALFDRGDGHLLHFVRSRMRTRERLEWNLLELTPVAPQAPSTP
jgi:hypothetical protein